MYIIVNVHSYTSEMKMIKLFSILLCVVRFIRLFKILNLYYYFTLHCNGRDSLSIVNHEIVYIVNAKQVSRLFIIKILRLMVELIFL